MSLDNKDKDRLIDVKELSKIISVKSKTIYEWVSQNRIPCIKLGKLLRFNYSTVVERLKKGILVDEK